MLETSTNRSPAFLRALTLLERAQLTRGAPPRTPTEDAQRKVERWREEPAFESAITLADRLAREGIDLNTFSAALDDPSKHPADYLAHRDPLPEWWSAWRDAYATAANEDDQDAPTEHEFPVRGFLNAVRPVIERARRRLREELRRLAAAPHGPTLDPEDLTRRLIAPLEDRLLWMISRTFTLELQVASLTGALSGETADERFASFTDGLRDPAAVTRLFEEYPVLARVIATTAERWTEVQIEVVSRLTADWTEIESTILAGREPGALVDIVSGAGDSHRGGRSVAVLSFSSGDRLVYKPRSLAVDRHLQDLLSWLNRKGFEPSFRVLSLLDRGDYGWSEFVSPEPCERPEEVEAFYTRLGGQLAVLYALEATDFHAENVIAAGDQPILPDVEALFQPRVGGSAPAHADEVAWTTINHSVVRVGLLPAWAGAGDDQIDVSGIGSLEGQLAPFAVPRWEDEGTDRMRLVRQRPTMRGTDNVPTLAGEPTDPAKFVGALVAGFTQMYRVLLAHRDELSAPIGPIDAFADDEIRVLLRATRVYAALQRESFHPDVLRDAVDRDRLFDRLWLVAESSPAVVPAVASEREDLLRGDIPIFVTRPSSRDMYDSRGRRLADYFDEPVIEQVRRHVEHLSEDDLEKQCWFIQASLATLASPERYAPPPTRRLPAAVEPATPDRLIDAAQAIGDRLEALALHGERDVSWIGLSMTGSDRWSLNALGVDLYDGLPGVALFLAHLGALTHERRYTDLARAAVETLRHQVTRLRSALLSVGAFDGWSGVIYALVRLGILWRDDDLLAEAAEIAELLPPLIDQDIAFDVIGGTAGAAAVLAGLHPTVGSPVFLDVARQAGERLLSTAVEVPGGIGWPKDAAGGAPLSGFSHGAAGIAWALIGLANATGDERFSDAAMRAIGYERTLFSAEDRNWRDLRADREGESGSQSSWCHGAMGIGLARLVTREHLDRAADAEIGAALRTTVSRRPGLSHSLCHGRLGNLELVLEAVQRLDAEQWKPHLDRLAAQILADISRNGWYCGTSHAIESPGLMTGLAGIGYGLLRVADPQATPSVLTLEAPAGNLPALGERSVAQVNA